jgi:hypothetical protein
VLDALTGGGCLTEAHSALTVYDERLGQTFESFPEGFRVDDIGSAPATCGGSLPGEGVAVEGWITLPLDPGDRRAGLLLPYPCAERPDAPCESEDIDLDEALARSPAGDTYAVVVSADDPYWSAGWA